MKRNFSVMINRPVGEDGFRTCVVGATGFPYNGEDEGLRLDSQGPWGCTYAHHFKLHKEIDENSNEFKDQVYEAWTNVGQEILKCNQDDYLALGLYWPPKFNQLDIRWVN